MSNFTFSTQNFWRGHSGLGCFSLSILQGRSLRLWSSLVSSECKVMQSDTSLSLICNLFVVISVWAWEWYKMEAHKIRRDIKLCTVVYNIHTKKKKPTTKNPANRTSQACHKRSFAFIISIWSKIHEKICSVLRMTPKRHNLTTTYHSPWDTGRAVLLHQ